MTIEEHLAEIVRAVLREERSGLEGLELLTAQEVAGLLKVDVHTVYRLRDLKPIKITDRCLRYRPEEVKRFCDAKANNGNHKAAER